MKGNGAIPEGESWASAWEAGLRARGGPPHPTPRVVQVDTTQTKGCKSCGRSDTPIYRHHKGFDSLTGQWNKAILYAYGEYKDCVDLCFDCNCEIHFIYEPYIEKWFNHTPQGARAFRAKLITVCDEWLSGKIPRKKVPKAYYRQFLHSLRKWQKAKGKLGTG